MSKCGDANGNSLCRGRLFYRELDKVGNTQDVSRFPASVTVVEKGTGV
jgi:hypothetical protein